MVAEHVTPIVTKGFGRRHREIRESKGLTQVEVALAYEISQGHLSKIERGRAQPGALAGVTLAKVSRVLKVLPERLFR